MRESCTRRCFVYQLCVHRHTATVATHDDGNDEVWKKAGSWGGKRVSDDWKLRPREDTHMLVWGREFNNLAKQRWLESLLNNNPVNWLSHSPTDSTAPDKVSQKFHGATQNSREEGILLKIQDTRHSFKATTHRRPLIDKTAFFPPSFLTAACADEAGGDFVQKRSDCWCMYVWGPPV